MPAGSRRPTSPASAPSWPSTAACARGERAIKILAPLTVKQLDEGGQETSERRIFFRTVRVFDVSQTEPLPGMEPVPLAPPAQPIAGDSHAQLIASLEGLARELGYRVEIRELSEHGPRGWCDPTNKQIVIAGGPANRQVRTFVHELAHALGVGYARYGRERAEVLVD